MVEQGVRFGGLNRPPSLFVILTYYSLFKAKEIMENNTILKDQEFNDIVACIYERYKDWYVDADFVGEWRHQEAVDRVEDIIDTFLTEIWVGVSGQYIYAVDASYLLEDVLEGVAECFREKGLVSVDDEEDE